MKLLIYGSGGLGRVVYDSVHRCNSERWDEILFINDYIPEQKFYGTQVISFESVLNNFKKNDIELLIAVGEPSDREKLYNKVKKYGLSLTTYIDDLALVSPTAKLEEGTIVMAHAMIDSYSQIGVNSIVQYHTVIGHDVTIGSNSVISSHTAVGGFSEIGDQVFIGIQATLKDRIKIGNDAIISMGSVIYKNIKEKSVVMGNPARITLGNNEHKVF